ncbi:hypothetical protein CesoFtcFv8_016729 [Champsocephalus esox]|uniref:Alkylated DNA repair protein AlkB homologue 8 N-terminal domain-containing protein n=1 Tax=Champsocephalus esox TaxID=159716 RepID=A0AAN8BRE9_9TELE|nr:hypothetical protein CesoFtcFv8_016729 [Champsocephalus esox]
MQWSDTVYNVSQTKEPIVDYRKQQGEGYAPIAINGTTVERVSSFRFLCVHITEELTWTLHTTTITKKARQRLFFLRRLRRFNMDSRILCNFYRCSIERILTFYRCTVESILTFYRCTVESILTFYRCTIERILTFDRCTIESILTFYRCSIESILTFYRCSIESLLTFYRCTIESILTFYTGWDFRKQF